MKIEQIIEKCGGVSHTASETGLWKTAIYYWINESKNGIPKKWHNELIALAKKQGNTLTKYDFVE